MTFHPQSAFPGIQRLAFRGKRLAAGILLGTALCSTVPTAIAQDSYSRHERAKRQQDAYDKRHHNTAKVVGGTAAGGALLGGLAGGGKGALIGAGAGAGAGYVADRVRKNQGVKKRERREY